MTFYANFPSGDFVPLFRLLDDYDTHRSTRTKGGHPQAARTSFTPKFDVRELKDSYVLDGELPGIAQNNIEIEFMDPHTLAIKGRVGREYNHTNAEDTSEVQPKSRSESPKLFQPTVEDEVEATNESSASAAALAKPLEKQEHLNKSSHPSFTYRVTERQVGEFQRTFTFPTRVNQDAVKANLKDGILSVIVPKAPAYIAKKIVIE